MVNNTDSRSLDAFYHLCGHARIHFHSRYMLRLLEDLHRQISGSWTDFKHLICRFQVRLEQILRSGLQKTINSTDSIYNPIF